jgi:hypothetical protein
MQRLSNIKIIILLLLITFYFFSCQSVPTRELDQAREAIRQSEKINAGKYASTELQQAKDYLNTAETQVDKKENEQAKENAVKARKMGDKAYFKALEEFLRAQNESTEKTKQDAKASHADKVVPDKYREAEKLYQESQKDMEKLKILSKKLKQEIEMQEKEEDSKFKLF